MGTHLFTGPGAASSERAAEQDTTVFADLEVVAARRSATLRLALTVIAERTGRMRVGTGQGSNFLYLRKKGREIVPGEGEPRRSSARGDRDDAPVRTGDGRARGEVHGYGAHDGGVVCARQWRA